MGRLELRLLGTPEVYHGGLPLVFPTRKTLALLLYLATQGALATREQLGALFWPESDLSHGQSSLRRALVHLRGALGEAADPTNSGHIIARQNRLGINPAGTDLDVRVVLAAAQLARFPPPMADDRARRDLVRQLAAAQEAYRGDFLAGLALDDAPDFDEWATAQREAWAERLDQIADRLGQVLADSGEVAEAIASSSRWVAQRRLAEAARLRLMRLYAAADDRRSALAVYESYRSELARELSLEPGSEIVELARRLQEQRLPRPEPAAPSRLRSMVAQLDVPFVGRARPVGQLLDHFRRADGGHFQLVSIEGESGIGKTRLTQELVARLAADGADVLQGLAFETSGGLPYHPIVDALRPRLERENAPEDFVSNVWLAELSRLFPELRERYPDLRLPSRDDAAARVRLFEAVARLGLALARSSPVVLLVDDFQWADAASLDLLAYCARRWAADGARLLVLLSLRSEELATNPLLREWLVDREREVGLTRLELGPLNAEDTALLVAGLVGHPSDKATPRRRDVATPTTDLLAGWLFIRTGGQPFFMLETLKTLLEREALTWHPSTDGRWEIVAEPGFRDSDQLRQIVPPGVRRVIQGRLVRLSASATALLAAAAVFGHEFTFRQVQEISGLGEDEALLAFDDLIARRLLDRVAAVGALRRDSYYTFSHDRIRDVVYTEVGEARRGVLHRRAFQVLRSAGAPAAELALHAEAGGLIADATQLSLAAGREALRLFAIRDGITHFERARALAAEQSRASAPGERTPVPNLLDIYSFLGRALELNSDFQQATAVYEEMQKMGQATSQPAMECLALNRLATLAGHDLRNFQRIMAMLSEAKSVAESAGDVAGLAETEWNLAHFAFYYGELPEARGHGERALALAQQIGLQEVIARSYNVLAFIALGQVRLADAELLAEQAHRRYVELGDRAVEAECLTQRACARIRNGRIELGLADSRAALAISRAIENPFAHALSAVHVAVGLREIGAYGEARAVAEEGLAVARALGIPTLLLYNLLTLGQIQRALLELDAAVALHLEAREVDARLMNEHFTEPVCSDLCADRAMAGAWDKAAELARQALSRRRYTMDLAPFLDFDRWLETAALIHGGQVETAREDLRRFGEEIGASPRLRLPYLRGVALLTAHAGNLAETSATLEEALTLTSNLGLPGEAWSIAAELSRLYRTQGDAERARIRSEHAVELIHALAAQIDDIEQRQRFVDAALGQLAAE